MTTKMEAQKKPRAIVMPLQPTNHATFDGAGMALHFLLGNTLVINDHLREMWFGWRVGKIFSDKEDLIAYCRSGGPEFDFKALGQEQKVSYWFAGAIDARNAYLKFIDTSGNPTVHENKLAYTPEDHLIGFRQAFMDWTGTCGLDFSASAREAALWPEKISLEGLDAVGRALEGFYLYSAYGGKGGIELSLFKSAVQLSPDSFMAQNILAWALYRNQAFVPAKIAFLKALRANPHGAGAMAGLMWCGVMNGDDDDACFWAARKAEARHEDIESAKEKALRLLKKYKSAAK